MINKQDLGVRICRMFNFIYEVKGDYYVIGRNYFQVCTDLELGVYKIFKSALEGGNKNWIIEQYKRVRRYTSDPQPSNSEIDEKIVKFVQSLSEEDLISLNEQVEMAEEYALIAYK